MKEAMKDAALAAQETFAKSLQLLKSEVQHVENRLSDLNPQAEKESRLQDVLRRASVICKESEE